MVKLKFDDGEEYYFKEDEVIKELISFVSLGVDIPAFFSSCFDFVKVEGFSIEEFIRNLENLKGIF